MRALPSLLLLFLLAGCMAQPGTDQAAGNVPPSHTAVRHDLAQNRVVAVPAGKTFNLPFSTDFAGTAGYSFKADDGDPVNLAFIAHSDLQVYTQGQTVSAYAPQEATKEATQQTALPAGQWDFVITCRNSFQDCDDTFSLWATY